jgi:hypothetical protein
MNDKERKKKTFFFLLIKLSIDHIIFFFCALSSVTIESVFCSQMTTGPHQVQITIIRKSDDSTVVLIVNEKITVGELKTEIRTRLPPKYDQGCRLIYQGKVLRSRRKLKYYGLTNNQAPPNMLGNSNIIMDDTKNWKSDSSSSSSEQSD